MKLTVDCAGAALYTCDASVTTDLAEDELEAPVILAPAWMRLISLMDMDGWMRLARPIPAGYCSTCEDRLKDLAAGRTRIATVPMMQRLLALAGIPADNPDDIHDHGSFPARFAAQLILATRKNKEPLT